MKCFKYEIYKDNKLILINWINRQTRAEALEDLKEDYKDHIIKITEV